MSRDCFADDMDLEVQPVLARSLPAEKLIVSAAGYNWGMFPEEALKAIVNRADYTLLTSLSVFYAGEPRDLLLALREGGNGQPALWQLDAEIVRAALVSPADKDKVRAGQVVREARHHNAALHSGDPVASAVSTAFEAYFPDAPAVRKANDRRYGPDSPEPFWKRLLGR